MKVIIAGSRSIKSRIMVLEAIIQSKFNITEVVSGGIKGVDTFGEDWARAHCIKVKRFSQNTDMINYAEGLIAVLDKRSNETLDILKKAKEKGMPFYIHDETERERIYRIADELIAESEGRIPHKNQVVYDMLMKKGPYTSRYLPKRLFPVSYNRNNPDFKKEKAKPKKEYVDKIWLNKMLYLLGHRERNYESD